MEIAYNIKNTALAEPSLKRNIVPTAKKIEIFAPFPWRTQPDSLWGHLPYPSVLQETEIEMAFVKKDFISTVFLVLPARLTRTDHRNILKLPYSISPNKRWITLFRISKSWSHRNFNAFEKQFSNEKTIFPVFMLVPCLRNHFSCFFQVIWVIEVCQFE